MHDAMNSVAAPRPFRYAGAVVPGTRVGTRFGRYELRALLGKGGMGEVYAAYDTARRRVVALKLLRAELTDDPMYRKRFRRESYTAAQMTEPHVIPIHDWGEIDGILYIDMRLVPGRDLQAVLAEDGALPPVRAVAIVEQIAAALDAAHAQGLVHRDVKPANILVTATDFAYLVDFGIAYTTSDTTLTATNSMIGSYAYMAPERFEPGPAAPPADVYALACILYECLTGARPFRADSVSALIAQHLSAPPPQPSREPGVPAGFDAVIARGMAKAPDQRFGTAGDLARAARSALTATGPDGDLRRAAPPPDPDQPTVVSQPLPVIARTTRRRRAVLVTAAAILLAGAIAAGVWWLWPVDAGHHTAVTLPAGTQECRPPFFTPQHGPKNGYASTAVGPKTTCGFAENVRLAYADGPRGTQRTITAHSPTTGQDYQLTCTPQDAVIKCTNTTDAVVYIY
jgi:serine/threonine-protein kinase